MYLFEFLGDSQVLFIGVSGRVVSLTLPTVDLNNFLERNSLKNYWLIKYKNDNEQTHIQFQLDTEANQENLQNFLVNIVDDDLSQENKNKFLEDYQEYINTESLDYLSYLIEQYLDLLEINEAENQFYKDTMPTFVNFCSLYTKAWPEATTKVNDQELDTALVLTQQLAFWTHVNDILKPLNEYILGYLQGLIKRDNLIRELPRYFHMASKTPFPNFQSLMPSLHEELANNLPFIGEKFNAFYKLLADQLSHLLEIEDLQFQPQSFPNPKIKKYLVVDLEKKTFTNNTPKYRQKAQSKISEIDESESKPRKKLDFGLLKGGESSKRFSPQKQPMISSRNEEVTDEKIDPINTAKKSKKIHSTNPGRNKSSMFPAQSDSQSSKPKKRYKINKSKDDNWELSGCEMLAWFCFPVVGWLVLIAYALSQSSCCATDVDDEPENSKFFYL